MSDVADTQSLTAALITELARVAGIYDQHASQGWQQLRVSALTPLRGLIAATGIAPTASRRTR